MPPQPTPDRNIGIDTYGYDEEPEEQEDNQEEEEE